MAKKCNDELERAVEAAIHKPGGIVTLLQRIEAAHPGARSLSPRLYRVSAILAARPGDWIHRAVVEELAAVVRTCGPQAVADVIAMFPCDGK